MTDKIDTFIGIAGANLGLTACYSMPYLAPTCGTVDGFYPGATAWSPPSEYLDYLNKSTVKEGAHAFAIFSTYDDLIGFGDVVWGKYTSEFPTQDSFKKYESQEYTHMGLRDLTSED